MLDIVRAIDGDKQIFECRDVRQRCAVFEQGCPEPDWGSLGPCTIHAVMLQAQQRMEEALAQQTVLDIVRRVSRKTPPAYGEQVLRWMNDKRDGKVDA
ncbi:hypothetical protein D3C78_1591600 [compost metagenome]